MDADSSDEEPDGLSLDEHELARKQAELALAAEIGNEIVQKGERLSDTVTWTVVSSNLEINTGRAFLPATNAGLVTGLPFRQGEPDLLKLWLQLYHGDIDKDIAQLNSLLRSRGHRDITQHEYVKFWGLIIAARQFSEKGKNLWSTTSQGIREAPNFGRFMLIDRFEAIRRAIPDLYPESVEDPWARFRPAVVGFNANWDQYIEKGGSVCSTSRCRPGSPEETSWGGCPTSASSSGSRNR